MPTKQIKIGNVIIGGGSPIAIQSMLSIPARDVDGNIRQAVELERAGCEILRVAVPDMESVRLVGAIKKNITVPLVADIHFDYRIALACVAAGIDKIRINPGNIGGPERVREVANACARANIPIRIGANGGSLGKELLAKYGKPTAEALCESTLNHAQMLLRWNFDNIVLALKSSDVRQMIEAYRLVSTQCDFPLHLGITEAGTARMGAIKSAIGIGSLLCDGIGDTIRVSLTADPVLEIEAAKDILKAIGLRGPQIISCPTCGRTNVDLIPLAAQVENALKDCKKNIKVAVMGCAVNGPGEAREADVGIAGGNGEGLLFIKGQIVRKVPENQLLKVLLDEIEKLDS